MNLEKGDMLIFSGEGDQGAWERYFGSRTEKSIRSKLSRERCGGDRWASAWIELDGLEDAGYPGAPVYGELGRDLNEIVHQRAVPADWIKENPAAKLAALKRGRSTASAENGKLGGRPKKLK
ncbi:MAG: hypothetical protein AB7T74_02260 [Clostridia bacterium]